MDMQEHIFSLKDDIASINIELEDIKDTIVESDFSAFKKNESHLKSFADELDLSLIHILLQQTRAMTGPV